MILKRFLTIMKLLLTCMERYKVSIVMHYSLGESSLYPSNETSARALLQWNRAASQGILTCFYVQPIDQFQCLHFTPLGFLVYWTIGVELIVEGVTFYCVLFCISKESDLPLQKSKHWKWSIPDRPEESIDVCWSDK